MKMKRVTIEWENGAKTEHSDPGGVNLTDIPGMMFDSNTGSSDEPQAIFRSLLTVGLNLIVKRFGLAL